MLITSDQQRTDTLSCMGNTHALSPNLDRLAGEGILFEDAYTTAPVCAPARISLLTGLHTTVHGAIENGFPPRPGLVAYPELLRKVGYRTIVAGKTHFERSPDCFEIDYSVPGEKASGADDIFTRHLASHGLDRPRERINRGNPVPADLFADAFIVDSTISGIEQVLDDSPDSPFFAHCSMLSPHPPWDPPKEWIAAYGERPVPPLNYQPGETESFPAQLRTLLKLPRAGSPLLEGPLEVMSGLEPNIEAINDLRRLYYTMAAYVDAQVGRLLEFLERRGLRENTLVMFTSDHGTMLWDHGIPDKHSWYDASWRVPLIMSMPGTLPENQRRGFAMWTDLTATILAAAGVEHRPVQGFDLLTPLAENRPSPRSCGIGHLLDSMALVTRRWKLEYHYTDGIVRLFDRQADPLERDDVGSVEAFGHIRDALLQALLRWRSEQLDLAHLTSQHTSSGAIGRNAQAIVDERDGAVAERHLNAAACRADELRPV